MQIRLIAALVVTMAGCGEDEGKPPPPLAGTAGSSPGAGGGETGRPGDDDGGSTRADMSTSGSDGDSGRTTGGTSGTPGTALVTGFVFQGSGDYLLPLDCSVRLHDIAAVDPGSGQSSGFLVQKRIVISEFPYSYELTSDEVDGAVISGDLVYVEVRCDIDGDGAFDLVGGWYPTLPAEQVPLPAVNIDVTLTDLPV